VQDVNLPNYKNLASEVNPEAKIICIKL
jgi:hypothetical protein